MRLLSLLLLASAAAPLQAQQPAPLPTQPQVNADGTVTFRYAAPAAVTKVALSLEGSKAPIPMRRDDAGLWTYTTPVLSPELYYYRLELDGHLVLDPRNMEIQHSLTSVSNSFLVPASPPAPWEVAAIPHGEVHRHIYTTKVVLGLPQNQSEFDVYTPPGYDPKSSTKYPVLYLLHGWSQVASDWSGIGRANEILDAGIAAGKASPMIVVMPLGYGDMSFVQNGFSIWNNQAPVEHNTTLFASALLTEVIPQVERLYNISSKRETRAIAGLSMGGLESLTIGLDHSDLFAYVGGMSAAVHLVDPAVTAKLDPKKANLKLLWIACGTADDLIIPNRKLAANLRADGFNVTTQETPGGLHTWIVWRQNLVDFTKLLFK